MELRTIFLNARCAVFEAEDGSIFEREKAAVIRRNGEQWGETRRVVFSVHDLKPDSDYEIALEQEGETLASVKIHTEEEFVTLNVRDFGARGNGDQEDTAFIQAAIMACPPRSRVLIPRGTYRVTSLFLKSGLRLELAGGAVLKAETDREKFPRFPGMIESWDEESEYNLGTWEGNPLPMFSGILTGIGVEEVEIYGQGTIDGCASFDNWWHEAKTMRGAFRPRMIFLERCREISVQGIRLQNSPTWVIHPYFSQQLRFLDISIRNPADSPNTDGLDPESCTEVEIAGVHFSLGDDCIAVKSGKIYMGKKYKTPSSNVRIRQCLMENGHGAVTVGSEIGAGARDIRVEKCLFRRTDRGLRIKTRRGRGEDSVMDGIWFDHIRMDHVMTPFVVNSFYFCDPDGKSEYVQDRNLRPVDERTPSVGRLYFKNIKAENCHVAAAFLCGLPEQRIGRVEMEHIRVSFAAEAKTDVPAMMSGVLPCCRKGFCISGVETLLCRDVKIEGQEGDAWELSDIGHFEEEN